MGVAGAAGGGWMAGGRHEKPPSALSEPLLRAPLDVAEGGGREAGVGGDGEGEGVEEGEAGEGRGGM